MRSAKENSMRLQRDMRRCAGWVRKSCETILIRRTSVDAKIILDLPPKSSGAALCVKLNGEPWLHLVRQKVV